MNVFYHILGVVAIVSSRLSRYRVNGIPSHLWIIFVAGIILGICSDIQLRDRASYGKPPVSHTVADVVTYGQLNQYVTLTGTIATDADIEESSDQHRTTYAPMYDAKTHQAILIQLRGTSPGNTSVTGMLRQIPTKLRSNLKDSGFAVGKYAVSPDFVLRDGDGPVNPQMFVVTSVIAGIPMVLLLACALFKNIIFQKTSTPFLLESVSTYTSSEQSIPMRYTGRLALSEKVKQRFLDTRAVLAQAKTGEWLIASQIDASIKEQFGVVQRVGTWVSVIQDGSLKVGDIGHLYIGLKRRPALRIRYTDVGLPKPVASNVVLSFDTEDDRDQMATRLRNAARSLTSI